MPMVSSNPKDFSKDPDLKQPTWAVNQDKLEKYKDDKKIGLTPPPAPAPTPTNKSDTYGHLRKELLTNENSTLSDAQIDAIFESYFSHVDNNNNVVKPTKLNESLNFEQYFGSVYKSFKK